MSERKPYQPVNCNFHDQLLHFATFKELVAVVVRVEEKESRFSARIQDVATKDSAEFVFFDDGQIFRLDDLLEVNGYFPNGGCRV